MKTPPSAEASTEVPRFVCPRLSYGERRGLRFTSVKVEGGKPTWASCERARGGRGESGRPTTMLCSDEVKYGMGGGDTKKVGIYGIESVAP